jgi:hypothetical protein
MYDDGGTQKWNLLEHLARAIAMIHLRVGYKPSGIALKGLGNNSGGTPLGFLLLAPHTSEQRDMPRCGALSLLCVCYLENHVFLGTRIERKISARDVFLSARLAGAALRGKISQTVSL